MTIEPDNKKLRVFRRPRGKLTVAQVMEALRNSGGIQAQAADLLKVNRSTICTFIKRHPDMQAELDEIIESIVDVAEANLITGMRRGEFPCIKLYLEAKGRGRGYGRNVVLSGPNGGAITVKSEKHDLSNLTLDELKNLEAMLVKSTVDDSPTDD